MTDKELAKYVLSHSLDEVIKVCKEIINENKELLEEPKKINFDLNENERLMALELVNTRLPKRGITVLAQHNINTIGELLKISSNELRKLPQLGYSTYSSLTYRLKEDYGLELKEY